MVESRDFFKGNSLLVGNFFFFFFVILGHVWGGIKG